MEAIKQEIETSKEGTGFFGVNFIVFVFISSEGH